MKVHELKLWEGMFDDVVSGKKRHECRINDRNFQVGDQLKLMEWEPHDGNYTGRVQFAEITYITVGGKWGIEEGYCVLSIQLVGPPVVM